MADKSELGELQGKVNALFVPPADTGLLKSAAARTVPKRFNEFRDEDMKEMTELLLELHRAADKQTDKKRSILDVINQCRQARTVKNPLLVKKALAIFLTHSPQAQELGIVAPPLKVQKGMVVPAPPKISPVTADTLRGYDLISYFREDHDINDHHWHWHLVYPYSGIVVNGKKVRALDRQGELFLYMHSQMLARYNTELVSWDHDITHAWSYGDFTTFGYTPPPSLQDQYTVRPPHTGWQDSDGTPTTTMDKWRNNILKAIENESIKTVKGADKTPGEFPLDKSNAMNWIGMITESLSDYLQEVKPNSGEFVDRDLYGMLHNMGHDKFASIPPSPGIDGNGVMGYTQTAVRDAVFWLWHRHIDDFRLAIIKKYEHSMDEYKPEAKITGLAILPQDSKSKTPAGGLSTILGPPQLHLDESTAKINHEPYKWEIKVESTQATPPTNANPQTFTVRLFIIPKEFVRLQRHRSWIEMDKFTHHLKAKTETITRFDTESSVARKTLALKPGVQDAIDPRCLCGWPQNMMLPVGRPDGMKFVAFAMLTNNVLGEGGTKAISFCGAKNRVYPDRLGMGYPFDKMWSKSHFHGDSTDAIPLAHEVDVAASEKMPHMMVTDFAIYRTTDKEVATPTKTD